MNVCDEDFLKKLHVFKSISSSTVLSSECFQFSSMSYSQI